MSVGENVTFHFVSFHTLFRFVSIRVKFVRLLYYGFLYRPRPFLPHVALLKVRRKLVASLRGEQTLGNTDERKSQQEREESTSSNAASDDTEGEERGGRAKDSNEDLEDLKRPLLLLRAVEVLVTSMVLLPPHGAWEDAMHCVRSVESLLTFGYALIPQDAIC